MADLDAITAADEAAALEVLKTQYLAARPGADMDTVIFDAIRYHKVANTEDCTLANFSIATQVRAMRAEVARLN